MSAKGLNKPKIILSPIEWSYDYGTSYIQLLIEVSGGSQIDFLGDEVAEKVDRLFFKLEEWGKENESGD